MVLQNTSNGNAPSLLITQSYIHFCSLLSYSCFHSLQKIPESSEVTALVTPLRNKSLVSLYSIVNHVVKLSKQITFRGEVKCVLLNVHYFINERLELYIVCTCSYSEVENVEHRKAVPAPSPGPSSTSSSADESLSLFCSTTLILKMSLTSHRPVKGTAAVPTCWTLDSAAGSSFIKVVPPQMSRVLIISSNVFASCLLH